MKQTEIDKQEEREERKRRLREMTEEEREEDLRRIAEEIRNLPYNNDRVGQAFIMFAKGGQRK